MTGSLLPQGNRVMSLMSFHSQLYNVAVCVCVWDGVKETRGDAQEKVCDKSPRIAYIPVWVSAVYSSCPSLWYVGWVLPGCCYHADLPAVLSHTTGSAVIIRSAQSSSTWPFSPHDPFVQCHALNIRVVNSFLFLLCCLRYCACIYFERLSGVYQ